MSKTTLRYRFVFDQNLILFSRNIYDNELSNIRLEYWGQAFLDHAVVRPDYPRPDNLRNNQFYLFQVEARFRLTTDDN